MRDIAIHEIPPVLPPLEMRPLDRPNKQFIEDIIDM